MQQTPEQYNSPQSLHADVDIEKHSPIGSTRSHAKTKDDSEGKTQEWKPQRQEWRVIATLATISLVVALDATILVPVLPTLAVDLHGTANEALWTGTSYLLTSAVFQPFIAAVSDIFGRRELLLPSLLLFTAGTAICCTAQDFTVILVGRCVQGVGGGGIITLSQVIFADIIPLRQRPKYFSVVLGAWALGSVLGPLIGGLFVEKASWRWCFYVNYPFCALRIPMICLCIPLKTEKTSLKAKLLRVDWLGGFLFIGGLTCFLIAITWAGVQFPWTSGPTLLPLTLGLMAVIAAVVWEKYGATEPFLSHSLFHNFGAIAGYTCALLQGLLLCTALYYVPFYLTSVHSKSPVHSGLDIFPSTVLLLPGSAIVSMLITRFGRFRIFMWFGWCTSIIGAGLYIRLDQTTKPWYWALIFALYGLGMGMILSSVNFATQANAHTSDAGRAAAMYAFMRSLGMAIGVAMSSSIFQNLMSKRLDQLNLVTDIARNAESFVVTLRGLEVTNPSLAHAILSAYLHGFRGVFVLMTGLCGLGLMLSLCIKHQKLSETVSSRYTLDPNSRGSRFFDGTLIRDRMSKAWPGEDVERQTQRESTRLGETSLADINRNVTDRHLRVLVPELACPNTSRLSVGEASPPPTDRPISRDVSWNSVATAMLSL